MSLEDTKSLQILPKFVGHLNYLWENYKRHVFWRFLTLWIRIWSQIAEKFISSWYIKIVVFVCLQLDFWGLLLFTKITYERQQLAILCILPSPRETLLLPIPSPGFSAKNFLGGWSPLSILVFRWERPQSNNWHRIDIRSSRQSWASNSLANTMVTRCTCSHPEVLPHWVMVKRYSGQLECALWLIFVTFCVLACCCFSWNFIVAFHSLLFPLFQHLLTNTSYL